MFEKIKRRERERVEEEKYRESRIRELEAYVAETRDRSCRTEQLVDEIRAADPVGRTKRLKKHVRELEKVVEMNNAAIDKLILEVTAVKTAVGLRTDEEEDSPMGFRTGGGK